MEGIFRHDMSVLIIAFNVTMSFRMMATMATLKGFPSARSFLMEGAKWLALCLNDAERGHGEDAP